MCQGIRDSTWGWRKLLKLRGMAEISEIFFWRWIPNILWHDSWHPDGILYENKKTKTKKQNWLGSFMMLLVVWIQSWLAC